MPPASAMLDDTAVAGETPVSGRSGHLVFQVGTELCALPLDRVRQVVRRPGVVGVPLGPPGLEGLANLHGTVTAMVDLHHVLGVEHRGPADAGRAVVIEHSTPVAFLADGTSGIVDIDLERIDTGQDLDTVVARDLLAGLLPGEEGAPAILVLDADRTLGRAFAGIPQPAARAAGALVSRPESAKARDPGEGEQRLLVSFEVDGQEYALPAGAVREVVRTPSAVCRVPHTRSHVVGVVTLRDRLVPLISARTLLGLTPAAPEAGSKVLLVSPDGTAVVGLIVDRARDVLRVRADVTDAVPALLEREAAGDIEAICRLDGGRRLVAVLAPRGLFRNEAVRRAVEAGPSQQEPAMPDPGAQSQARGEAFVVVRLGGEEYGLPVDCVDEIVRTPDALTPVPKAPEHVAGIMNRRGAVLPVIDQRRRFALPGNGERRHIVVVALGALRVGLLVDAVAGVFRIPVSAIGPTPDFSAGQARLISRVASLGERMILLIDPEHLLESGESARLAEVAGEADADDGKAGGRTE